MARNDRGVVDKNPGGLAVGPARGHHAFQGAEVVGVLDLAGDAERVR